jgi:hypothetical protein
VRQIFAATLFVLVTSSPVLAATPAVPRSDQQQLRVLLVQVGASDLALVPTSLPAHFAFESYSVTGTPPGLDVSFADRRFLDTPTRARAHEISFDTDYFKGSCPARSRKTFQVGGTTVYADGTSVWRCLRAARGRVVRTTAHGHLTPAALAILVASARPVT